MAIMMLLPVIIGALAGMINSWDGFLEAAFMDMTLTLESFQYGFGPGKCGDWIECGNATFDSYVSARNLAMVLFVLALVAVALKDMIVGGFDVEVSLEQVDDRKSLPEMLKYSLLVFLFLFIFPPMWDVAAGTMNNIGVWILNPHYNFVGKDGEYIHGEEGRKNMCSGELDYDDIAMLAPTVREFDKWAIYRDNGAGPLNANDKVTEYHLAENYIVDRGGTIPVACLHSDTPNQDCAHVDRPPRAGNYQLGDILCNPDYRVKYVFRQAIGFTEMKSVSPESILGSVSGIGSEDVMVGILMQFLKSSVTLQVIMVIFMTGVMVDIVTAFALAIIPIVPFYRFLPMSKRVQLGDYSGAAFALLAMPLVASLVIVAGAGAVANIAADGDQEFQLFFVWLAALSVLLLVIGIPATMVPLIGSGVAQATAAVQTGVQTAQFAATATAAVAGGAIKGRRDSMRFNKLKGIDEAKMTSTQKTDFNQLKERGFDKMSTARAAVMGASGGLRGQVVEKDGSLTTGFQQAVAPDTSKVTAKSAGGALSGFGSGVDAVSGVSGLTGDMTKAAQGVVASGAAEARKAKEPTEKELLEAAKKQEAEAKEKQGRKVRKAEKAGEVYDAETAGYKLADDAREAKDLAETEDKLKQNAEGAKQKLEAQKKSVATKMEDARNTYDVMESDMSRARQEQIDMLDEMKRNGETLDGLNREYAEARSDVAGIKNDREAAEKTHADAVKVDKHSQEAKDAKEALGKIDERLDAAEKQRDGLLDKLETANGDKIGRLEKDMKAQTTAIGSLEGKIDKLDKDIASQSAEMQRAGEAAQRHGLLADNMEHAMMLEARNMMNNPEYVSKSGMKREQAEAIIANHEAQQELKAAGSEAQTAEQQVKGIQNEIQTRDDKVAEAGEKPDVDGVVGGKMNNPSSGKRRGKYG